MMLSCCIVQPRSTIASQYIMASQQAKCW